MVNKTIKQVKNYHHDITSMEVNMKVDTHIHSLYSDGIYTIEEILEMLLKRHVEVFSITDHDTVDGIKEVKRIGYAPMTFVSGIEFTCKEMQFNSIKKAFSIHLLGYGFDEDNAQLLQALKKRKENVENAYDTLCRHLSMLNYPIKKEEIPISCGNVLQLRDVTAHVKQKYPMVSEDILTMIEHASSVFDNINISVEDAIQLIHNAGGKAIWAHPFCVYKQFVKTNITEEEVVAILELLKNTGLDGMEAYYHAFSKERQNWLYALAKKNNMIYTAGSDFHGSKGRDFMGIEL